MADVDTGGGGGGHKKGSGPKTKKKSTRIDMTAMVDVAFLLLTFFVLTATMSDNAVMELTMPPKTDDQQEEEDKYKKILEDKIMTVVLDENNTVKYFVGITDPEVQTVSFDNDGVRKALLSHISTGKRNGIPLCKDVNNVGIEDGRCWDPIFVIKAKKEAKYRNLVDVLDELAITQANKYAIDKYTDADSVVIAASEERAAAEGGE
ncbi:biopolymer transporter ExbD [Pontibacter sp. G13]|uniref:ExbD/TolR family protein n=1 Tax=Pontibacter sp. G13 TaxID=3074898 RepID=UPI002889CA8B|nr:biopolymer transporter ExbD [Pontibacter sp. G13]WNJ16702.1 biopolymer transporter ExbD [Pontibacter sp. G13]